MSWATTCGAVSAPVVEQVGEQLALHVEGHGMVGVHRRGAVARHVPHVHGVGRRQCLRRRASRAPTTTGVPWQKTTSGPCPTAPTARAAAPAPLLGQQVGGHRGIVPRTRRAAGASRSAILLPVGSPGPLAGERFHLYGVAGAGMAPLAVVARHLEAEVTGCDRAGRPDIHAYLVTRQRDEALRLAAGSGSTDGPAGFAGLRRRRSR